MKKLVLLSCVATALAACDFQRTIKGTFVVEGQKFNYVRTNTEVTTVTGDDESDSDIYTVTFPDGTQKSTWSNASDTFAREERDRIAREWLKRNPPATQVTKTTSSTSTGTTQGSSPPEGIGGE